MAGFGGSVKLTGESEYRSALQRCTESLRTMSSALKSQVTDFSSNDNSMKKTITSQNELNKSIKGQETELSKAKNLLASYSVEITKQSQTHSTLTREYKQAVSELNRLEKELGTSSEEYKKQAQVVNTLGDKLAQSQLKLNENKEAYSNLKKEINNSNKSIDEAKKSMNDLGKEEDDLKKKTKETGDGFTVFKGILANLGTQAINSAINGIKSMGNAVVGLGKQVVSNYASYEQLTGGVETLFKDSADIVKRYADEAYKTSGLSANEYMNTVTSFSASMIQSLGGDTKKSAELSNQAIIDMSDNANKMGTDMSMIQSAYQGFAKQNYTMLDNLKLGYGGTKSEMERLLKDAEKLTGKKFDISNFADITEAIHAIQTEMGITGTTAKEASQTIEGSLKSMGMAWKNLVTGLGTAMGTEDIINLAKNFSESMITAFQNITPVIDVFISQLSDVLSAIATDILPGMLETGVEMISNLLAGIQENLPTLMEAVGSIITQLLGALTQILPQIANIAGQIIMSLATTLIANLPQIADCGLKVIVELVKGIAGAMPTLIPQMVDTVLLIVETLIDNIDLLVDAGIQLLTGVAKGLVDALPRLIEKIPILIDKLITALTDNLPLLVEMGIRLTVELATGIVRAIPQLVSKIPQIIGSLLKGIANYYGKLGEMGVNLLKKLIEGIGSMLGALGNKAKEIGTTIIDKIKNLPKEMMNWGKDMIQGMINGIKNMIGGVKNAVGNVANTIKSFLHFSRPDEGPLREYESWMPDMVDGLVSTLDKASPRLYKASKELASDIKAGMNLDDIDVGYNANGSIKSNINSNSYDNMVVAFQQALSSMKIELDDEVAGKFVKKTVEDAIYV